MKRHHKILFFKALGIKPYIKTVSVVNMVMVCPDGRLLLQVSVSPIMVKLLLLNVAAGLGTEKKVFSTKVISSDTNDEVIRCSQILGRRIIKMVRNESSTSASPSWVRLNSKLGN